MSESSQPKRKYVLVEAVQQFRQRYVVELDEDSPSEWALDSVTMNEVKELSSESLGEVIVSHRVLPGGLKEAIALARSDSPWMKEDWSDERVVEHHIGLMPKGEAPEKANRDD